MSGSSIRWDAASKVYPGPVVALESFSAEARAGETLALVGRSGSGKSTALRLVNRLIEPTAGRVTLDGRDVRSFAPEALRRSIGTVLAKVGLCPHLTAVENVALLPRALGEPRAARRRRALALLERVGLAPGTFAERSPAELSSGEQQRVGLARALALEPRTLLLDEPTSALDPLTRRRFQDELLRLRGSLGATIVLVTHDMEEAERLADRIAVLDAGRLVQAASAAELRARPVSPLVASFFGRREAA